MPTSDRITIRIRPRKTKSTSREWVKWIEPPERRGGTVVGGLVVTVTAVPLGFGLIFLYLVYSRPNGNAGIALFAGAGCLVYSLFRAAKQMLAPHALKSLDKDSRPPVLLLRAFRDDGHRLAGYSDQGSVLTFGQGGARSFEEYLYDTLSKVGPVIAIGRPGEQLAPLGASRFWVRDKLWKKVVDHILDEAQYAVLIMGALEGPGSKSERQIQQFFALANGPALDDRRSESGLAWEFARLLDLADYEKVLFVMPPIDESEAARRWYQYRALSGDRLPPYQGGEIAIAFDESGAPLVSRIEKTGMFVKSFERNLLAYRSSVKT